VAILGQICCGSSVPKSCDSCCKHLTLKFHSSDVMFVSCPAPAFPAASLFCAQVPRMLKVLQFAVPRNASPVAALNAVVPITDASVGSSVLGVLLPASPAGCKHTHVHKACLVNTTGSLSRGSDAVAVAILFLTCSAFCLVSRVLIRGFISLPKAKQRDASVRMPRH